MAATPVGSATWRDASYRTIHMARSLRSPHSTLPPTAGSQGVMRPQDEDTPRKVTHWPQPTPPPFHRDLIVNACNAYARDYMRETQSSVSLLRQALWETDRHIQRLQRERDVLERTHANTRRDMLTNDETTHLRTTRPMTERYPDKADVLLQEERDGLLDLKRHTERQLHEIARQLQILHSHRKRLWEFCKEKSRVLDLVSDTGARPQTRGRRTPGGGTLLGPGHKDCQVALSDALTAHETFLNTQPPNWQKPRDCAQLKESVTEGLHRKAEETAHIREEVTLAMGNLRNTIQRQQRLHEELQASYNLQLGPESSLDLSVRERLDRPLVRILQRHPGTQLPESTLVLQGSAALQRSVGDARGRIGALQAAHGKLRDDQENKLWGERLDRAAARLRTRSAKGRRERL